MRDIRTGDEEVLLRILRESFGSIEYLPRVRSDLSRADPNRRGIFVFEKGGSAVGCIAIVGLPRRNWYDLRYLAVRDAFSNSDISGELIQKAVANIEARGYEYLKATTPAVQPYVDMYEKLQFTPVRRTLRLAWEFPSGVERREHSVEVRELSKVDAMKVGEMIVEGHLPYWDWWFEEQGGPEVSNWPGKFGFPIGTWLGTMQKEKLTSLAGFLPDAYGPGEARLECFCVLPRFRGMGIGSALLSETLDRARRMGQRKLVIYTFAYFGQSSSGSGHISEIWRED